MRTSWRRFWRTALATAACCAVAVAQSPPDPAASAPIAQSAETKIVDAAAPPGATAQNAPALDAPAPPPPPPAPLELVPYRVQIHVAIDVGVAPDGAAERRRKSAGDSDDPPGVPPLVRNIAGLLAAEVGAFWDVEYVTGADSWVAAAADVPRMTSEECVRRADAHFDKVFFLGLSSLADESSVAAREWDQATATLSPLQTRRTYDARTLPLDCVAALYSAFRPLVHIEQDRQGTITLRGRGALVSPHDSTWNPLSPGTVFEPYYRYLNKERKVERIQRIPWTYLVAGESAPDEGRARGEPLSGLRTAISARRRRIEAVALGIRTRNVSTVVRLKTRPPGGREIAGAEVQIRKERILPPPVEGQPPPPPLARLVSDRRGRVAIPVDLAPPGGALWLFVYSGSQLLGRVPFVPGLREVEDLELADDSLRLQVEGEIALLQARLVDMAAQRAVLMATIRKRAEEKNFTAADELMKKLDAAAKPPALVADLNTVRLPALKTAQQQRDRATEARIKKLGDDTAEIINVHFSNETIAELKDEVQELKLVAQDEAAGIKPRERKVREKKPPRAKVNSGRSEAAAAPPPGG